jgi:hypothetical protein
MEAICTSETSVDIQRTTRSYNPEDNHLLNHRCENLKSYIQWIVWNSVTRTLKEKFSIFFFYQYIKFHVSLNSFFPYKGKSIGGWLVRIEKGREREVDLLYLSCQKPALFFRKYIKLNGSRTNYPECDKIDIYFIQLLFVFTLHFFLQTRFKRGWNTRISGISCHWSETCGAQASLLCQCVYIFLHKIRR